MNYDLIYQVSLPSADGVNKFDLTMLKSDVAKPFRVTESTIQLECKVNEIIKLGTEGGVGNLVI